MSAMNRTVRFPSGHRSRYRPLLWGAVLVIDHAPDGMRRYFRRSASGHISTEWTREEAARYSRRYVNVPPCQPLAERV